MEQASRLLSYLKDGNRDGCPTSDPVRWIRFSSSVTWFKCFSDLLGGEAAHRKVALRLDEDFAAAGNGHRPVDRGVAVLFHDEGV